MIRFTLPDADPYLFPLVAVLACFGLVVIYRLDADKAISQAGWFVVGPRALQRARSSRCARLPRARAVPLHDRRSARVLLLLMPRVPGISAPVNGAYLGVDIGPVAFQPAEFAKIGIVVFLAAYLREHRDVMILSARRFLGLTFPPLKHFGPLLVVWAAAMVVLFFIRDIGSSLMFFGAFLAILYVATNRLGFVVVGLLLFVVGALSSSHSQVGHIQDRVDIWLDPLRQSSTTPRAAASRSPRALFAQADGGLFGRGFGGSLILTPLADTDLIYAVIVNELGLAGACGLILVYLLLDRARLQDGDDRARLVLDAARGGPDGGARAAGVRDHRRRHPRDPADGRDAAVRLLRRLVDPRQLRPAGAAAAGLRPRAA